MHKIPKYTVDEASQKIIFKEEEDVMAYAIERHKLCLVWDDEVLDASDYKYRHPGGQSILNQLNGTDITQPFTQKRHSSYARQVLDSLKVGYVDHIKYSELTGEVNNTGVEIEEEQEIKIKQEKQIKPKLRVTAQTILSLIVLALLAALIIYLRKKNG